MREKEKRIVLLMGIRGDNIIRRDKGRRRGVEVREESRKEKCRG
jgi:hypothetical protein